MSSKAVLRKRMLALRRKLSPKEAQAQAARAEAHLLAWPPFQRARTVLLYAALPGEMPTERLLEAAKGVGKRVALPCCGPRPHMIARAAEGALREGRWGIPEPEATQEEIPPEAIDLIICPGLAFDRAGGRLGYGAGYYDVFLSKTPALRAGLCFLWQLVSGVPQDPWDLPMQALITPQGILSTHVHVMEEEHPR